MTPKKTSAGRAPFAADRAAAMAAECDSWGDLLYRAYLLWRRDEAPATAGSPPPPASRAEFLARLERFERFQAVLAGGPISDDSPGTVGTK